MVSTYLIEHLPSVSRHLTPRFRYSIGLSGDSDSAEEKHKLRKCLKRMKVFSLFLFLSASAAVSGAPMVGVTCVPPLSAAVYSSATPTSANCNSFGETNLNSVGGASATGQVSLVIAANAADFSVLSTYQYAYAQQGVPQGVSNGRGATGASSVTIAYSQDVVTAGTTRSGYVQIEAYGSGASFYDGGASMTSGLRINTDPYNGSPATEVTCQSSLSYCTPGTRYYNRYSLIPVTLGIALTIEANGSTVNYASYLDGASGGSLSTTYNFRFLEADGLTPVRVTPAPEPATCGLMGAALVLAGWVHRRKVKCVTGDEE